MSDTTTHYRGQLGTTLKNGRYTLIRKLGEGTTATAWLVLDGEAEPDDRYFAAKILSAEDIALPDGPSRELEFLQAINEAAQASEFEAEGLNHLFILQDHFTIQDRHLCFVGTLCSSSSLSALRRSAPNKRLPLHIARNSMNTLLCCLDNLQGLNIVDTDVQLGNILFSNTLFGLDERLEKYLEENPAKVDPETHFPEIQPLPHKWTHEVSAFEAELMSFYLVDYGNAEWTDKPPRADMFCPSALRPPEVILGSGFGSAIDIWAVGCLTWELIAGCWLFAPQDGDSEFSIVDDHLAKMQEFTGQRFSKAVLSRAKHRSDFFDQDGDLLRIPELTPLSIEQAFANYEIEGLSEADIKEAADFIRCCLELDHEKRPTAKQLLKHSFMRKAFGC